MVNFLAPGSGSAFRIWILIQESPTMRIRIHNNCSFTDLCWSHVHRVSFEYLTSHHRPLWFSLLKKIHLPPRKEYCNFILSKKVLFMTWESGCWSSCWRAYSQYFSPSHLQRRPFNLYFRFLAHCQCNIGIRRGKVPRYRTFLVN